MAFILYQSMNLILCALVNINLKYLDSISRNEYLVTISFNYFHTHLIFFRRYREKYKISEILKKVLCVKLQGAVLRIKGALLKSPGRTFCALPSLGRTHSSPWFASTTPPAVNQWGGFKGTRPSKVPASYFWKFVLLPLYNEELTEMHCILIAPAPTQAQLQHNNRCRQSDLRLLAP